MRGQRRGRSNPPQGLGQQNRSEHRQDQFSDTEALKLWLTGIAPVGRFFCLWLVMWSNPNYKIPRTKNSAESKKKSTVFKRKQRILWSCYPDLNWRPHPYQRDQVYHISRKSVENRLIPCESLLFSCAIFSLGQHRFAALVSE